MNRRTPLSTMPLADLLELYEGAQILKLAKRTYPGRFNWDIEEIEKDMNEVYKVMETKIPQTHMWEIEKIKAGLHKPLLVLKPGQNYRHRMIGLLRIELVQQDEVTGLWSCRQFVSKLFSNRVHLKESTITEHYKLMNHGAEVH